MLVYSPITVAQPRRIFTAFPVFRRPPSRGWITWDTKIFYCFASKEPGYMQSHKLSLQYHRYDAQGNTKIPTGYWSGSRDSNPGPLRPERSALPYCATPRFIKNHSKGRDNYGSLGDCPTARSLYPLVEMLFSCFMVEDRSDPLPSDTHRYLKGP